MFTFDIRRLPAAARRSLAAPRSYWLLAATVAVGVGALTFTWLHRAETLASEWGEQREVLVVTARVAPGGPVSPADLQRRSLPVAVVPDDAVDEVGAEAAAAIALTPGMVLTTAMTTGADHSALAARVPAGMRAVAVPRGEAAVPVVPGDNVDLVDVPSDGRAPTMVAEAAPVLAVDETAVTVAVPGERVLDATRAAATRTAQLALVGGG